MSGRPISVRVHRGRRQGRAHGCAADGDRRRGRTRAGLSGADRRDGSRWRREAKPDVEAEMRRAEEHGQATPRGAVTAFDTFGDFFTPRQLVALTTFSDLVQEARERVKRDALAAGLPDDGKPLAAGGTGATRLRRCGGGVSWRWRLSKAADYISRLRRELEPRTLRATRSTFRSSSASDDVGLRRSKSLRDACWRTVGG